MLEIIGHKELDLAPPGTLIGAFSSDNIPRRFNYNKLFGQGTLYYIGDILNKLCDCRL